MLVGELTELLKQYPAGLRVVVNGYEEGYDDLTPQRISTEKISVNRGPARQPAISAEKSLPPAHFFTRPG